ncbi:ATP-binding protein, partial [Archaeoglobales archaeon]
MQPIGLVKGPAESPLEFKFITPDKTKLKSGEFVYYYLDGKKVICRILKRTPLRLYPDLYLSKPTVEPERILKALNINLKEFELFEI